MTVNELLSLSKNLNELCSQAEDVVNQVAADDPCRARLLEHLRELQKVTRQLSEFQDRR